MWQTMNNAMGMPHLGESLRLQLETWLRGSNEAGRRLRSAT